MKRENLLWLLVFLLFVQGYLFNNIFPALLAFSIVVYLLYINNSFSPLIEFDFDLGEELVESSKNKLNIFVKNLSSINCKINILDNFLPHGFKLVGNSKIKLNREEFKKIELFVIPKKGKYIINPKIRILDNRELYYLDIISKKSVPIKVIPSIDSIKKELQTSKNIKMAKIFKKSLTGIQSIDISTLRKFQPGDSTKQIDWKATARLNELIVKEFEKERRENIYIILDTGKEIRKGIRKSKIDYATVLALQLVHTLKKYGVNLIIYDEYKVLYKIENIKSVNQIYKIFSFSSSLPNRDTVSVKLPRYNIKIDNKSKYFVKKIFPLIKRRKSIACGIEEAVSLVKPPAFLIFIVDINSNTNQLIRLMYNLRDKYKILLITPNPILFYDITKVNNENIQVLYKRYLEREELIRKLNYVVPTIDVGPSDLLDIIGGAIK